jgi:hypothetical protein
MATLDDRVVGTVRWNVGNDEHLGYYENLYRLREFRPFYPHAVSITTKMIVAADFRRSRLPMQLCVAAYGHALERGVIFDVIDCNPPLVKFFQRFGYRQVFPEIVHPEYGRVVPLVLALHDTAHLRKIKSPFVGDAAGLVDEHDSDAFLNSLRAASGPLSIGENVNVAAGVGEPPTAAA